MYVNRTARNNPENNPDVIMTSQFVAITTKVSYSVLPYHEFMKMSLAYI